MKQCPTCGSSYTDDTLLYCLQDGATLQSKTNPLSMVATLRDDSFAEEERTSAASRSSAPTVEISAQQAATSPYDEARATESAAQATVPDEARRSHTTRVIVISVVATVLILGLGGLGAWLFFRGAGDGRGRERRVAQENSTNVAADSQNTGAGNQSRAGRPDKGGRWFVILGTFPNDELNHANERLEVVRREGFDARLVSSDDYPNMKSGQWVVVLGPSTRNQAEELLDKVKPKFKDAYTKSGW